MKAVKQPPIITDNDDNKMVVDPVDCTAADVDLVTIESIRENIRYIERSVSTKEVHYMSRAVRNIGVIRSKLTYTILRRLVDNYYPSMAQKLRNFEIHDLNGNSMMDVVEPVAVSNQKPHLSMSATTKGLAPHSILAEVEIFVHLLFLLHLLDNKMFDKAVTCSDNLIEQLGDANRRIIYPLSAKCFYFYYRSYELAFVQDIKKIHGLRPLLLNKLRLSTLHNDYECQAVIINLLLRNYVSERLYDQANMLVSKVNFPENASNTEHARHHYYLGKIKAVRLEYSDANDHLQLALRKAPTEKRAIGFKQTTYKLHIIVQLLLGELPDRTLFRVDYLAGSLVPYFELTQAVRIGNLAKFNEVLQKYSKRFQEDDVYNMIIRLRHNVIKTGVRRISLSYSKISLADIAEKLCLDNPDDVEFIVAKAIRDGVIDASIDHIKGCLITRNNVDVYATSEPYAQLNQRIQFCLNIRNQSVKAMRYPAKQEFEEENIEERHEMDMMDLASLKEEDYDDF